MIDNWIPPILKANFSGKPLVLHSKCSFQIPEICLALACFKHMERLLCCNSLRQLQVSQQGQLIQIVPHHTCPVGTCLPLANGKVCMCGLLWSEGNWPMIDIAYPTVRWHYMVTSKTITTMLSNHSLPHTLLLFSTHTRTHTRTWCSQNKLQ